MPSEGSGHGRAKPDLAEFGEPDLVIAGLQMWVHGRQFPESEDEWDGNWLVVTAHCSGSGASVRTHGAILMVTDIARFGEQCAALARGERQSVALDPLEPELKAVIEAVDRHGHLRALVDLTPDHMTQRHRFEFAMDKSHLPDVVRQCAAIMMTHPIRGRGDRGGV